MIILKVLYFDIAAIPILLIILVATFVRRATKGATNKFFIAMVTVSLGATLADLGSEYGAVAGPLNDAEMAFVNISTYIYFVLRNGTVLIYLLFLFAVTRTTYKIFKPTALISLCMPYIGLLIFLFTNPIHHKIFYIAVEDGYHRGSGITVLYCISLMYFLCGIIFIAPAIRYLTFNKWLSLISLYAFSFASIIVQYFNNRVLIEMFSTAVAFLLVIILVLRPEEIADSSVGLPSFYAYRMEIIKLIKTKREAQMFIIRLVNSTSIRSYIGEERYDLFIKEIAHHIGVLCNREGLSWELYYERPGAFYIIVDNMDYSMDDSIEMLNSELRHRTSDIANMGVRFDTKVCVLRIPEDSRDYEDIIHFGHEFYELMTYDQLFTHASDIISSKDYQIRSNMGVIINQAIQNGRLEMYYQPIYSVKRNRYVSAEALVRLKDERYGTISPALFIPEAENKGMILPIGNFVLESVFGFASMLDFDGLGIEFLEINLSVAQCRQSGLPGQLAELSSRYDVPPERINLEITETTYDDVGGVVDKNIRELVSMGFSFSLDDYGTGYSNIQRVTKLPFENIKIDKSLVDEIDTTDGMTILANTIRMMKGIRKKIIAEGAETREAVEKLKLMECDYIQGFYYARPMPASKFIEFIEENHHA